MPGRSSTGREKSVAWGISEAAYSALDAHQIYQYRAFGVPDLAIQPDLDEEPVVAPYASMLALMIDPQSAIPNLQRLDSLGLDGPMGFYESIDFSRESKRDGSPGVVIYAYMAHHQGMSLVAIDNVLHHGAMQRRFHNDPRIRAVESLLFERIPITKPIRGEAHTRLAVAHVTAGRRSARGYLQQGNSGSQSAPLRQRPVCADGFQLRRGLQPVESVRSHPLAFGSDARRMGKLSVSSRPSNRYGLGGNSPALERGRWARVR